MRKEGFSYRQTKDGKVFVRWRGGDGRRGIVFKGARAAKLLAELSGADEEAKQLALARATGNFKRGNERHPKR